MTCKDLVGVRFGRLVVISRAESIKRNTRWNCRCDCGNEIVAYGFHLRSGATKSCGCWNNELVSDRFKTHGKTKTRLFRTWQNMRKRCENPKLKSYKNYGGKGVKVCEEWKDYLNFRNWAYTNGYSERITYNDKTIDRINPYGNYEPQNCRIVDWVVQRRNRRKDDGK